MDPAEPPTPVNPTAPCPLTGHPARLIQVVSVKFLRGLWRAIAGERIERLYGGRNRLGLYESPCGLMFFAPMIAGDEAFYRGVYGRTNAQRMLGEKPEQRQEFIEAASHLRPGDAILDVGCGAGDFRMHAGQAAYRGIDPYATEGDPLIASETIAAHADRRPAAYDLVCAFQVIEHVADPLGLVIDMARAVRPGGRIVLCAPLHPSPLTEMPNNPVNGPPHHLTWWNRGALEALCRAANLEPLELKELPPSPHQARFFWTLRLTPFRTDPSSGRYYASRKTWTFGLWAAFLLSAPLAALFGLPCNAKPVDVFLVARKPARTGS